VLYKPSWLFTEIPTGCCDIQQVFLLQSKLKICYWENASLFVIMCLRSLWIYGCYLLFVCFWEPVLFTGYVKIYSLALLGYYRKPVSCTQSGVRWENCYGLVFRRFIVFYLPIHHSCGHRFCVSYVFIFLYGSDDLLRRFGFTDSIKFRRTLCVIIHSMLYSRLDGALQPLWYAASCATGLFVWGSLNCGIIVVVSMVLS
jgi:hypothetical protein